MCMSVISLAAAEITAAWPDRLSNYVASSMHSKILMFVQFLWEYSLDANSSFYLWCSNPMMSRQQKHKTKFSCKYMDT